jgi:hypothetical protein
MRVTVIGRVTVKVSAIAGKKMSHVRQEASQSILRNKMSLVIAVKRVLHQ